jgi:hypothetical protein
MQGVYRLATYSKHVVLIMYERANQPNA